MHIVRVKLSATAFETKGIIRHGWIVLKFSKSNLKANPGKVIEQIRERLGQRKPCVPKNETLGVMGHGPAMVNLLSVRKIRSLEYV